MAGPALQSDLLLETGALLTPDQARTFICHRFHVPRGTRALRLRLAFDPPRAGGYNNLLTLSLFDPQGFRGAGLPVFQGGEGVRALNAGPPR